MNRIKIDERIESGLNAFFETAPDWSHFELTYTGHESALVADKTTFSEKADKWSGMLREIFMFGPGTFSLFYLTLTIIFFYPSVGLGFQGLLMYFFAVFLTYAGSGSIKNLKNLAVPGTVIVMALAVVFFSALFPGNVLDLYFWDSIYLFPVVLIAAKLVQAWVAHK